MRIKTIIPDSYVKGAKYLRDPIAIELKKFAYLPHKELVAKQLELEEKYGKKE